MGGSIHIRNMSCKYPKISCIFPPGTAAVASSTVMEQSASSSIVSNSNSAKLPIVSLSEKNLKTSAAKAEIRFVLKAVASHMSFRSCDGLSDLFQSMFPDSDIARHFSLARTKCTYLATHGLEPYYRELLLDSISRSPCYVISFDECLNSELQNEQMDFVVRYWDAEENLVTTRFFDSAFLGRTRAQDLLSNFREKTSSLDPKKLLQISMDGPATNWKFFNLLCEERKASIPECAELLNLGSCGLHIVHGALQTGHSSTGWGIDSLLRALWFIFHDSPSRREEYISLTCCSTFPLKFCAHRWIEDIPVADRALEIWEHICSYIMHIKQLASSKQPKSSSYSILKERVADHFTVAKLNFFLSVARQLHPILIKYQSSKPLVPYLAADLEEVLRALFSRFISSNVMSSATSVQELLKIKPGLDSNFKEPMSIDIGFGAKNSVQHLLRTGQVSDNDVRKFRVQCRGFLGSVCTKLMSRFPLKYPIVRALSSLAPYMILSYSEEEHPMFSQLLQLLMESKWMTAELCDKVNLQYSQFSRRVAASYRQEFADVGDERLDIFFRRHFSEDTEGRYTELWELVKKLLILSHGQADIERGYSINKETIRENMNERTMVALRRVYDGIRNTHGDVSKLPITQRMLTLARSARMRYNLEQDEKRKLVQKQDSSNKRKYLQDCISTESKKKKRFEETVKALEKEADSLSQEAEKKCDFKLLSKSNALRSRVKELKADIQSCVTELEKLHGDVKKQA